MVCCASAAVYSPNPQSRHALTTHGTQDVQVTTGNRNATEFAAPAAGNAQAATFIYVLYMLLEHKLAAAHEKLSGRYREALLKVLLMLPFALLSFC